MMQNNRYAAGITLYYPDMYVFDRLKQYSYSFDCTIAYMNSQLTEEQIDYCQQVGVILLGNGKNKGLSVAYNEIIAFLRRKGEYDFLCTLDQDSTFRAEDINSMKEYINIQLPMLSHVGIIAPFISYNGADFVRQNYTAKKKWVITSGAFVNLGVLENENVSYDEQYFIDKFDIDLCQQLIRKGYVILQYYGSVLYQEYGYRNKYGKSEHVPLRHYYSFRNRFYFNKKYFGICKRFFLNTLQTLRHLIMILLYENEKIAKLHAFINATCDYFYGRLGEKEQ